jgi:hypothetical protein
MGKYDALMAEVDDDEIPSYGLGNINLNNRPKVKNSDGSISTVRSMSFNADGKEILVPTVSDDGRIMSNQEAIQNYMKTGRYLGKFNTPEESNTYAEQLHKNQEAKYATSTNSDEITKKYSALMSEVDDEPISKPEPKKETFLGGIGSDLSKRGSSLMNNASRDESFPEYAVQQVGELAGGANDVLGRVAAPIGNAIGNFAKNNLPNVYKAGKATGDAIGRGISKALPDLGRVMNDESNQGETVRGIGNILTLGGLSKLGKPVVTEAAIPALKGATNITGKGLELIDKTTGKVAQELTNTPEEALRLAGTKEGRKALQEGANQQFNIGKKLVKMVDNADDYIPEREIVNKALKEMPPINMSNILNEIDNAKVFEGSPSAIAANKRLDGLKDIYTGLIEKKKKVDIYGDNKYELNDNNLPQNYNPNALGPASKKIGTTEVTTQEPIAADKYRELRKQLDYEMKSAFNKDPGEASIFEKQAMQIRTAMKNELERSAEASGNPEYITAMKSWSDKLGKIEDLKSFLGKNSTSRSNRAESFVSNLYNMNKSQQQKTLQDISEIFGNDFNKEAKTTYLAKQLGDEGKASWTPNWTTGKSLLGSEMLGKVAGLAIGSPKVASRVTLPTTKKIGDFGKYLQVLSKGEKTELPKLGNQSGSVVNPFFKDEGVPLQTKSDNFKNWFGDWEKEPKKASKIVDERGVPTIVYHGTNGNKFDEFDSNKSSGMIWLTGNREYAKEFTSDGVPEKSLYANIKNPLDARSFKGEHTLNYWKKKLFDNGVLTNNVNFKKLDFAPEYGKYSFYDLLPHAGNNYTDAGVLEAIKKGGYKKGGYDGILAPEESTNGIKSENTIVAFYPNQIKSSINNSGAFNPGINNIRGRADSKMLGLTALGGLGGITGYELSQRNKK